MRRMKLSALGENGEWKTWAYFGGFSTQTKKIQILNLLPNEHLTVLSL